MFALIHRHTQTVNHPFLLLSVHTICASNERFLSICHNAIVCGGGGSVVVIEFAMLLQSNPIELFAKIYFQ